MSSRVSLRGGGDVLSRRLASVRADILARGEVSYRVSCAGYPRSFACKDFFAVVRAFARLRKFGFQQCQVYTIHTLQGLSVFGGSPDTWLLLPSYPPVLLPSKQKKRRESSTSVASPKQKKGKRRVRA